VSDFKGHEQRLSPLPENFHQAWLHLLTAVLLIGDESTLSEDNTTDTSSDTSSNSSSDSSSDSTNIYFTNSDKSDENLAEKHLRRVTQELYDGRHALDLRLASTSSQDLRNFELSDARGVAALVIDNLSSHRVAPPYSVLGMYDSHLAKIVSHPTPKHDDNDEADDKCHIRAKTSSANHTRRPTKNLSTDSSNP
jgi:hypothetical protein